MPRLASSPIRRCSQFLPQRFGRSGHSLFPPIQPCGQSRLLTSPWAFRSWPPRHNRCTHQHILAHWLHASLGRSFFGRCTPSNHRALSPLRFFPDLPFPFRCRESRGTRNGRSARAAEKGESVPAWARKASIQERGQIAPSRKRKTRAGLGDEMTDTIYLCRIRGQRIDARGV
jgi:hypothetical protein